MKKKLIFLSLIIAAAASAFAQKPDHGRNHPTPSHHGRPQVAPHHMMPRPMMHHNMQRPSGEAVTVSGNLAIAHGRPAVKNGDVTYLIGGLNRLAGFVDGLKEGAQITIEGSAISRQKEDLIKFLRPAKLTLNGKTYEMELPRENFRQREDFRNPEQDERAPRTRQTPPPRPQN